MVLSRVEDEDGVLPDIFEDLALLVADGGGYGASGGRMAGAVAEEEQDPMPQVMSMLSGLLHEPKPPPTDPPTWCLWLQAATAALRLLRVERFTLGATGRRAL